MQQIKKLVSKWKYVPHPLYHRLSIFKYMSCYFFWHQAKEDATELRAKSVSLKSQIEEKEKEVAQCARQLAAKINQIGSIVSPIAPVSDTEDDNKVMRTFGEAKTNTDFLTHVDLVRMIDGVEYTNGF